MSLHYVQSSRIIRILLPTEYSSPIFKRIQAVVAALICVPPAHVPRLCDNAPPCSVHYTLDVDQRRIDY